MLPRILVKQKAVHIATKVGLPEFALYSGIALTYSRNSRDASKTFPAPGLHNADRTGDFHSRRPSTVLSVTPLCRQDPDSWEQIKMNLLCCGNTAAKASAVSSTRALTRKEC